MPWMGYDVPTCVSWGRSWNSWNRSEIGCTVHSLYLKQVASDVQWLIKVDLYFTNITLHSVQPYTRTPIFISPHPIPVSKDPCFISITFSVPNYNLTPLIHFGTLYARPWLSSPFLPIFPAHPDWRYRNPVSDLLIPPHCACIPALFSVVIKASYQCIVESVWISIKYDLLAH